MSEPIESVTVGELETYVLEALKAKMPGGPLSDMVFALGHAAITHALALLAEKYHIVPKGDGP